MNIVKCTNGHFLTAINTMSAPIVLKRESMFLKIAEIWTTE